MFLSSPSYNIKLPSNVAFNVTIWLRIKNNVAHELARADQRSNLNRSTSMILHWWLVKRESYNLNGIGACVGPANAYWDAPAALVSPSRLKLRSSISQQEPTSRCDFYAALGAAIQLAVYTPCPSVYCTALLAWLHSLSLLALSRAALLHCQSRLCWLQFRRQTADVWKAAHHKRPITPDIRQAICRSSFHFNRILGIITRFLHVKCFSAHGHAAAFNSMLFIGALFSAYKSIVPLIVIWRHLRRVKRCLIRFDAPSELCGVGKAAGQDPIN